MTNQKHNDGNTCFPPMGGTAHPSAPKASKNIGNDSFKLHLPNNNMKNNYKDAKSKAIFNKLLMSSPSTHLSASSSSVGNNNNKNKNGTHNNQDNKDNAVDDDAKKMTLSLMEELSISSLLASATVSSPSSSPPSMTTTLLPSLPEKEIQQEGHSSSRIDYNNPIGTTASHQLNGEKTTKKEVWSLSLDKKKKIPTTTESSSSTGTATTATDVSLRRTRTFDDLSSLSSLDSLSSLSTLNEVWTTQNEHEYKITIKPASLISYKD